MLQQVVDYQILSSNTAEELSSAVRTAITNEWVPSGPAFVNERVFYQVVVKFDQLETPVSTPEAAL
jgi:hypothetical protein